MNDDGKMMIQTDNWDMKLMDVLLGWQNEIAATVHKRLIGNDSNEAVHVRQLMLQVINWHPERGDSNTPSVDAMNLMASYAEQMANLGCAIGVAWLSVMLNAEELSGADAEARQHKMKADAKKEDEE